MALKDGIGYVKTAKNGKKFISCNLTVNGERVKFGVFKNDYKDANSSASTPDYTLLIFRDDPSRAAPPKPEPPPQEEDDNIPF